MNTSCSEFVVCQQETFAPLILSEFTGTASTLTSACLVNPWDYSSVAKTIFDCLEMSGEQKRRSHAGMIHAVKKNTFTFWAESFLNELTEFTKVKV
jgi:trehalose-6-phosphate synthase